MTFIVIQEYQEKMEELLKEEELKQGNISMCTH